VDSRKVSARRGNRRRIGRIAALPAVVALFVLAFATSASQARVATSKAALSAPTFAGYSTGVFHWSTVARADHYEFQLANDKGFNSPVLGNAGNFSTWSTSATLPDTVQDGKYWWRVRAVRKNGSTSKWVTRSFTKAWLAAPALLAPANNTEISFPTEPLLLSWQPVLGAVRYEVAIARDSKMTSLVDGTQTVTTATSDVPPATLSNGTYYWTVTPVDAEKHEGTTSAVHSFSWTWPTSTTTTLANLVENPLDALVGPPADPLRFYDPLLSWTSVAGAAKYELDVNFSSDFNASSRVCCSSTTVATGYSPTRPLPNNTYYWRVRPINTDGAKGDWTSGLSIFQYFDTFPPLDLNNNPPDSAITGLHVEDDFGNQAPGAGWSTPSPIVRWDPVTGASAYDLNVFTMRPDGVCDIQWADDFGQDFHKVTPLTEWTPLAKPGPLPYPSTGTTVEQDSNLAPGDHYCVRIRAVGETSSAGQRVYGDYSFLPAPGTPLGLGAFIYNPATAPGTLRPTLSTDYLSPIGGANQKKQTPFFTWKPIPGANSYWVIVSRDSSFTTLADYAFTQIPAYAPRKTFADEKTSYYWAVLPAANGDGTGLPTNTKGLPIGPLDVHAANFQKQTDPPQLISPTPANPLPPNTTQPIFQWTPVEGARNYTLQVSTDPNFGTLLDDVVTGSTGYVSTTTYPAQSTLYWRVQANDEDTDALTWSSTGTFKQTLQPPTNLTEQAPGGDFIPAWRWKPVVGAIGYDVRVVYPGGSVHVYEKVPTPAMVPVELKGTGVFTWQVRADFSGGGVSPYSPTVSFQRTVAPPAQTHASVSAHALILRWQGRPGLDEYVVQISARPDFSHTVEKDKTDGTEVASNLKAFTKTGGKFYWRVAAVDANGNLGGFSPRKTFKIHRVKVG